MSARKLTRPDLLIDGSMGFYQIAAQSRRGEQFMQRVQGAKSGTAFCDDTRMTQEIADGAAARGLRVLVNGVRYEGQKQA